MDNRGLHRQIFAITLPAFAALISEPLMLAADTAIVGRLGREQLAALGASGTILGTVIGFCIFLAYGSTAVVSRAKGAGEDSLAMSSAAGTLWLATGLGSLLVIAMTLVLSPLSEIFASSHSVQSMIMEYLSIAIWSIPAALIIMAGTGILRGVLDLKTPLVILVAANLLNVVTTLILVFVMNLGLSGAAAGLAIAQWVGALWIVLVIRHQIHAAHVQTGPDLFAIMASLRDGLPILIRTMSLRAVLVIATWLASNLGDVSLAAHQVVMTLMLLCAFALDALAIAGQTLTGHALGSADKDGARTITRTVVMSGWLLGLGVGLVLALGSHMIPRLFSEDSAIIETAGTALIILAITMPIAGVVYVLDGVLIGAGDGRFLAWAGIWVLLAYLPLALAIYLTHASFTTVWWAYAFFIFARFLTLWLRQRSEKWMILGSTAGGN